MAARDKTGFFPHGWISGLARWLQFPAADGSAAFPQNGRGHFLEADHGAEFFLDRQLGQLVATPLLGGKE
jgi:hypothetical protein